MFKLYATITLRCRICSLVIELQADRPILSGSLIIAIRILAFKPYTDNSLNCITITSTRSSSKRNNCTSTIILCCGSVNSTINSVGIKSTISLNSYISCFCSTIPIAYRSSVIEAKKNAPKRDKTCFFERVKIKRNVASMPNSRKCRKIRLNPKLETRN